MGITTAEADAIVAGTTEAIMLSVRALELRLLKRVAALELREGLISSYAVQEIDDEARAFEVARKAINSNPGLNYAGTWKGDRTYDPGDIVTVHGRAWKCLTRCQTIVPTGAVTGQWEALR